MAIKSIRFILFTGLICFMQVTFYMAKSQAVYYHHDYSSVYSFLDEMANAGLIDLNSTIRPYTRTFIANKLQKVKTQQSMLNQRQQKELAFYLRDFNKELKTGKTFKKRLDLFYHSDSTFTFSVNPVGGIQYFINHQETGYHRWNGAKAFAYINNWGFYASLRDNHESIRLSEEPFLNQRLGANYKAMKEGGGDYSEMRGGITYQWNWGHVGIVKDHVQWGSHHHSPNIFSGRTPSFGMVKLNIHPVEWFEFNYFHGYLVSELIDSARIYTINNSYGTTTRELFRPKYISANMFSFRPFKQTWISLGNSVVYGDREYIEYIIPVMFYKSIDHTLNATYQSGKNLGQNSQMFFDLSSRIIPHLHVYSSIFVDELAIYRWFDDSEMNFVSYKTGFELTNIPKNTWFTAEYTKTNPLVYRHNIPITTFRSNGYNLGHYLEDNALELYLALGFRPFSRFKSECAFHHAKKGDDYTALGTNRVGNPFMDNKMWEKNVFKIKTSYQIINDGYVFAEYWHTDYSGNVQQYTAPLFRNVDHVITMGLNYGF